MPNAIEQIYDKLTEVFGGTNPNQFFAMLMPGTTLDPQSYAYDTTEMKPAIVQEAESKLCDQMFDIAKVSGSSNGQRVSSQYLQALSVLVPNFNVLMPELKNTMRLYLNSPVPEGTVYNNQSFTGSLQEYYFKLYSDWIETKLAWERQIIDKKNELSINPGTEKEKYLEWYEQVAESELAKIDAAMGKVLTVFSPSDMNAILGALASGPGGEIDEATNTANNIRMSSPNGGYFYPVDLKPADWFLDLASEIDPVDLLQDPVFIAKSNETKMKALQASLNQVKSLLDRMPTNNDIDAAKQNLDKCQSDYNNALTDMENQYGKNTVTAANIVLKYTNITKDKLAKTKDEVEKSKGTTPDNKAIGDDIQAIQAIQTGMADLNAKQSKMTESSMNLADAGLSYISKKAGNYANLPLLLTQLQSQIADLKNSDNQLAASAIASVNKAPIVVSKIYSADVQDTAKSFMKTISSYGDDKKCEDFSTALKSANTKESDVKDLQDIIDNANTNTNTTSIPALKNLLSDKVQEIINTGSGTGSASQSKTSERFMELQFSFSSSAMISDSKEESEFSQSSWGLNLFICGASGGNSSSSAQSTASMFNSNTEIKIGLKAAKVEIDRGWFNPGVFKLSKDMDRLSTNPIAYKPSSDSITKTSNEGILPCFPVAFVVAKDVTLTFDAGESSLDSMHSIIDSKKSSGGGFLCFSSPSSSSKHSESQSMKSVSNSTTIHIAMPQPQILGWFIELTPEDKSTIISLNNSAPKDQTEMSIIDFVRQISKLSKPVTPSK